MGGVLRLPHQHRAPRTLSVNQKDVHCPRPILTKCRIMSNPTCYPRAQRGSIHRVPRASLLLQPSPYLLHPKTLDTSHTPESTLPLVPKARTKIRARPLHTQTEVRYTPEGGASVESVLSYVRMGNNEVPASQSRSSYGNKREPRHRVRTAHGYESSAAMEIPEGSLSVGDTRHVSNSIHSGMRQRHGAIRCTDGEWRAIKTWAAGYDAMPWQLVLAILRTWREDKHPIRWLARPVE